MFCSLMNGINPALNARRPDEGIDSLDNENPSFRVNEKNALDSLDRPTCQLSWATP